MVNTLPKSGGLSALHTDTLSFIGIGRLVATMPTDVRRFPSMESQSATITPEPPSSHSTVRKKK